MEADNQMAPPRKLIQLLILAVAATLLAACGTGASPSVGESSASASPAGSGNGGSGEEKDLDDLYQDALAEGGTVVWYSAMPAANAEVFIPIFEKRFPGMKVQQTDQTAEEALARAITEKRAGRVVADVFGSQVTVVLEATKQGLLLDYSPPEAEAFPDGFKGSNWTASDVQSLIVAWNTNEVDSADAPRTFEALTDAKWKDAIIAEPDDWHMLIAFANSMFGGDQAQARELLESIAANNVQFHSGHSELAELLTAGQAKVCFGCYSHHFPPRMDKGAPVDYSLDEGVANIVTTAITDGAPHPASAKLFVRWQLSEEGQQAYATAGRTPALPSVDPDLPVRADPLYPVGPDDFASWPDARDVWQQVFQLR